MIAHNMMYANQSIIWSLYDDVLFMLGSLIIYNSSRCFISGETLQDERTQGGSFIGTDGLQFPHKLIPVSIYDIYI